ncbi:MAG: DUF2236 domain-containing protein [Actinomycetota bacterium]|nr:DUF2236 domain-containing protein [Actinomycetota bacterium]
MGLVGHDGLFAPDSVTWRIHADPVCVIGGMRALLIQALEPRAMAGVDQHSSFREDPWARFRNTATFITTATFGRRDDAERVGAVVRRVHQFVQGNDPVTGQRYRADDPELLAWVHNVLVHSLLMSKRRYGGGITAADADRYIVEMTRLAELVGLPADEVPHSAAGLRVYFRDRPLVISEVAHEAKRTVLAPPLPARVRPAWALLDVAAVALLPKKVRDLYGLTWWPTSVGPVRAAASSAFSVLRAVSPGPPELRAARERLAA